MANNYFFTGEKGIGKSTLINLYLAEHFCGKVGGFKTVKKVHEGNRISFHLVTPDFTGELNDDNLLFYCHDASMNEGLDINERFNVLSAILDDYDKYDIIIMDEIGPHEENAEVFKDRIRKVLDSDKYVLGVIQKSESKFLDEIRKREDVKILDVTKEKLRDGVAYFKHLFDTIFENSRRGIIIE